MSEEEKKAIEDLRKTIEYYNKRFKENPKITSVLVDNFDVNNLFVLLNLIEKQQKELNNLKEIEKSHQEENGKLREEIIRLDNVLKAKKQEIAYLKIQIPSDRIFYFSDKDYISKDKIKEMKKYREFELQQEYKEFEEDVEWRTYKKILEDK